MGRVDRSRQMHRWKPATCPHDPQSGSWIHGYPPCASRVWRRVSMESNTPLRLVVDAKELHAAAVNEQQARAAAGITLALSDRVRVRQLRQGVLAHPHRQHLLLHRLLGSCHRRPAPQPYRVRCRMDDTTAGPSMGLGQAQAIRLDARVRHVPCDGRDHQPRHPRTTPADDLPDLPESDVDGGGARTMPRVRDLRRHGAAGLASTRRRIRGLRERRV